MDRRHTWLNRLRRYGLPLLVLTLLAAIVTHLGAIDWRDVARAIHRFEFWTLAQGLAIAALSLLICSSYDLLGRHYVDHRLPTPLVLRIAFVGYTFTLNLGSLIGGLGFRLRLYLKFGLDAGDTSRVIGTSVFTNWAGYVLLAGLVFTIAPPHLTLVPIAILRVAGPALLLATLAYLTLCLFGSGRQWRIRDFKLYTPPIGFALLQLLMSSISWLLIVAVIKTFMPDDISYARALVALLVSAIAGVVTFVPGGIGVLESVFIALMGSEVPATRLLAGLIAYRFAYYLLPFASAVLVYLHLEWRARHGLPREAAQTG